MIDIILQDRKTERTRPLKFDGNETALMNMLNRFEFIMFDNDGTYEIINRNEIKTIRPGVKIDEIPKEFIIDDAWSIDDKLKLLNDKRKFKIDLEELIGFTDQDTVDKLIDKYQLENGNSWYEHSIRLPYYKMVKLLTDDDIISYFKYALNK